MSKHIQAIQFAPDSITLTFVDEGTDVRADGLIYQTHTIVCARAAEAIVDEIDALEDAALTLLREALGAWAKSLPFDIDAALRERGDPRGGTRIYADDDE